MTVVGYCRLSRDEDKENYSSIEEQKRILSLFGREKDLKRILILNHYLLWNYNYYIQPKWQSAPLRSVDWWYLI